MNRRKRKNIFIFIFIIIFFCFGVGYSYLNSSLFINGTSIINANVWEVGLDNVEITTGSVVAIQEPVIDLATSTTSFEVKLDDEDDFYEFTVDVVNNGNVDAKLGSLVELTGLSNEQGSYFNYSIRYQNNEPIEVNQLVKKGEYVRLKSRVEYKEEVNVASVPESVKTLNLGFKLNYDLDDGNGVLVKDNGIVIKIYNIVSGDLDTIGSEVCVNEECFYVISSDSEVVKLFAKYNLYAGNHCLSSGCTLFGDEATNLQDSTMIGYPNGTTYPRYGTIEFAPSAYWTSSVSSYPAYVYNSESNLYNINENYKLKLEAMGAKIENIRLIKKEELESLGCSGTSCTSSSYLWTYSTSYWTGTALSTGNMCYIRTNGYFAGNPYSLQHYYGVRPVIEVLRSEF